MPLTAEQTKLLAAPLSASNVKQREQGGRQVSYIEGWHVIAEANRIFGFGGWTRETVDLKCVAEGPCEIGKAKAPGFSVTYTAMVRVKVGDTVREGCGAGHGIDRSLGQAHESAIKEAETDAMKRAFMTFGNPFGLALYDKQQAHVATEADIAAEFVGLCEQIIKSFDPEQVGEWWNSDEQKQQRRDHKLSQEQVDALKRRVVERIGSSKKAA